MVAGFDTGLQGTALIPCAWRHTILPCIFVDCLRSGQFTVMTLCRPTLFSASQSRVSFHAAPSSNPRLHTVSRFYSEQPHLRPLLRAEYGLQKQKPLNSFWWILALGVSSNKAIESGKSLA